MVAGPVAHPAAIAATSVDGNIDFIAHSVLLYSGDSSACKQEIGMMYNRSFIAA